MADVSLNGEKEVATHRNEVGDRLFAATHHEDLNHHEEVKTFLNEQVPDYCQRVAALVSRPEAADLMEWIKEQAQHEDNHLFRILAQQIA